MLFSGIYIIEFEEGIKIGMSDQLNEKVKTYKNPWIKPIKSIHTLECQFPQYVKNQIKFVLEFKMDYMPGAELDSVLDTAYKVRLASPKGIIIDSYFYNKNIECMEEDLISNTIKKTKKLYEVDF